MRIAPGVLSMFGAAVWAGSWYLMHLEITRWHHVKPSLAFNADIAPGAHPGQPLLLLYVACAAGPVLVLASFGARIRARRSAP